MVPRVVSTLKPKRCTGKHHTPLGDPAEGRCVLCGKHVEGREEPAPTSAETLYQILYP